MHTHFFLFFSITSTCTGMATLKPVSYGRLYSFRYGMFLVYSVRYGMCTVCIAVAVGRKK